MLKTFTPPEREGFASDDAWGDAYWKARQDFIAAGHSERHEDYCLSVGEDGTRYAFQVQQMYESLGSQFGGRSSDQLPWFTHVDKAIEYLEAAAFPGAIQRAVAAPSGKPGWMTAGVAYIKWAGERDYWKARNQTPNVHHWHPELGQTGPEPVPCTRCSVGKAPAA